MRLLVPIFSLVLVVTASLASAQLPTHSAYRAPGETVTKAAERYIVRLRQSKTYEDVSQTDSAMAVARPLAQLDSSRAPQWRGSFPLTDGFLKVRDTRFIKDPDQAGFMRRSSWLYPDDGCFARAQLMRDNLAQWGGFSPGKVFIFGNLQVKTPNSPNGSVGWWYHVVPVLKNGQQIIVFDPAIDPSRPLTLLDWIKTMTPDPASVKLAVCDGNTYGPSSSCGKPASQGSRAGQDQLGYLRAERQRLVQLGRDPKKELGDNPPWLKRSSLSRTGWAQ